MNAETKQWKNAYLIFFALFVDGLTQYRTMRPTANASSDLVWAVVKRNNRFIQKSGRITLSSEKNNLTSLNSKKSSGLVQDNVSVFLCGNKMVATRSTGDVRHPKKRLQRIVVSPVTQEKKLALLAAVKPSMVPLAAKKIAILNKCSRDL